MNEIANFLKWDIPIEIRYTKDKGRYIVATKDFPKDSRIVVIKSYSTSILDSYKKKV